MPVGVSAQIDIVRSICADDGLVVEGYLYRIVCTLYKNLDTARKPVVAVRSGRFFQIVRRPIFQVRKRQKAIFVGRSSNC
jgi:hypothetical protein